MTNIPRAIFPVSNSISPDRKVIASPNLAKLRTSLSFSSGNTWWPRKSSAELGPPEVEYDSFTAMSDKVGWMGACAWTIVLSGRNSSSGLLAVVPICWENSQKPALDMVVPRYETRMHAYAGLIFRWAIVGRFSTEARGAHRRNTTHPAPSDYRWNLSGSASSSRPLRARSNI